MKWFQTLCSENVPTYEPLLNKTACDFDKELKPMVFKHLKDR